MTVTKIGHDSGNFIKIQTCLLVISLPARTGPEQNIWPLVV